MPAQPPAPISPPLPPPTFAAVRSSRRTQTLTIVAVVVGLIVVGGLYGLYRHSSTTNGLEGLPHTTTTDADGGTTETFQLGPAGKAGDDLAADMVGLGRAEYDYEYANGQYTSSLPALEQAGYQPSSTTPVDIWIGTTTAGQKGYCFVGSAGDLSEWLVNGQTSSGVSVIDGATSESAGEKACQDSSITNYARVI
jgi:hypothetical protein